jgi:hypothetical protein
LAIQIFLYCLLNHFSTALIVPCWLPFM